MKDQGAKGKVGRRTQGKEFKSRSLGHQWREGGEGKGHSNDPSLRSTDVGLEKEKR